MMNMNMLTGMWPFSQPQQFSNGPGGYNRMFGMPTFSPSPSTFCS